LGEAKSYFCIVSYSFCVLSTTYKVSIYRLEKANEKSYNKSKT
jgi:hypothetical protein